MYQAEMRNDALDVPMNFFVVCKTASSLNPRSNKQTNKKYPNMKTFNEAAVVQYCRVRCEFVYQAET